MYTNTKYSFSAVLSKLSNLNKYHSYFVLPEGVIIEDLEDEPDLVYFSSAFIDKALKVEDFTLNYLIEFIDSHHSNNLYPYLSGVILHNIKRELKLWDNLSYKQIHWLLRKCRNYSLSIIEHSNSDSLRVIGDLELNF